jgi:hypothetical protein
VEELQEIADELAETIGRGVAFDDRHLNLLVHSAHDDHADPARKRSILTRTSAEPVVRLAFAQGIDHREGPIRIPAAPALGLESRIVFPLRSQGLLLGFLTIIDAHDTLSESDTRACAEAATVAAGIRYRQRMLRDAEREHEHRLVRELLFGERPAREGAAEQLANEGLLPGRGVAAMVLRLRQVTPTQSQDVDMQIRRACDKARHSLPAGSMVEFPRSEDTIVVVEASRLPGGNLRRFADLLLALAREQTAGAVDDLLVGVGTDIVAAADARSSHDQALRALRAADRLPGLPNPVGWDDLGVNRLVAMFPLSDETLAEVPQGCRALFEHPELLKTVECYLDLACDVKATSAELILHRASLYSRLQKAERITGLSFKSGDDRLALQLGLRLLRLAGNDAGGMIDRAA